MQNLYAGLFQPSTGAPKSVSAAQEGVCSVSIALGNGAGASAEDLSATHNVSTVTDNSGCGTVETLWPAWRLAPWVCSS